MPQNIEFSVNGIQCRVDSSSLPRDTTLNAYLRYSLQLPGTKAMCHEGGCGSCIVTVTAHRQTSGTTETFSVNSCLVLVFSCHGWEITTIEGLGNRAKVYDDIQKRFASFHATQCGYCTPGWIMSLNSLRNKGLSMAELEKSFGSNTCRCTGFRPILDVIKSFATDASPELCNKVNDIEDLQKRCCKTRDKCERKCSSSSTDSDWAILEDFAKEKNRNEPFNLDFKDQNYRFSKVYTVEDIFETLDQFGSDSYMLVDGNTSKGLYENFEYPRVLIDISDVKSLKKFTLDQNLVLGANMSLEDTLVLFKQLASSHEDEFAYLKEMAKHIELVAHIPVRKIGSLAGNLMTKLAKPSYQSDIFLLFEAVGGMVTIRDAYGVEKTVTLTKFLKTDMNGKLMKNIILPPLSDAHVFKSYKIMPRNQNALAIVNAAFLLQFKNNSQVIKDIKIVYGNIGPDFDHAKETESFLVGKNVFSNETLQSALKVLKAEVRPVDSPPEPSPATRQKIALGLFYKFILNIAPAEKLDKVYRSGGNILERPVSKGKQDFQSDPALYPLNAPVTKYEAQIQASGEAVYSNDLPTKTGKNGGHTSDVFAAFVLSTIHSGELDIIDGSEVLKTQGVLAVYTAKDIPGINSFAVPGIQLQTENEEILASKDIKFYGQPVAILVASSERLAAEAAKKVKVTYKNISKNLPVLTIEQAKLDPQRVKKGTNDDEKIVPKRRGTNVKKVIKGKYQIEAQYHYYIEPVTCVVVPLDRGLKVYDASQWMDLTQTVIAKALNMHESDIHVTVRRVGGGFGGKISRNVQASAAAALVATKLDRVCRIVLPIQTNLATTGRRLPCNCHYEVGVDDDGVIQYLDASLTEDNGCSHNETILNYVAQGFPNCYDKDTFNLSTSAVLTDLPANSFARAPGTNEGISTIEHILEHISYAVGKDPTQVRLNNMTTKDNDLPKLIKTLKKEANYNERLQNIKRFNEENRWMKKGMSLTVMLFPVQFYGNYSAMVSVYRNDGTVTVSTGGIEMGQGVNTKAAQVCAYELGIPLGNVSVIPSYSFVAANNVFSGSSIVSESVCYAISKACGIIKDRLKPLKTEMKDASWAELVKKAGDQQIDLTATFMMMDKEPDLANYNAFAVTIIETQLDVLTGRYNIERVDILEDAGLSANPATDIGQVEGAYIQGLGYYTTEKLVYDKQTGKLLTNRSLNYHVPLALDIPIEFNVKLRYNSSNPKGVLGSKAVGEMGICSAHGITHVLRQSIVESRKQSGYDATFIDIDIPYDTESILKALDVKPEEFLLRKRN